MQSTALLLPVVPLCDFNCKLSRCQFLVRRTRFQVTNIGGLSHVRTLRSSEGNSNSRKCCLLSSGKIEKSMALPSCVDIARYVQYTRLLLKELKCWRGSGAPEFRSRLPLNLIFSRHFLEPSEALPMLLFLCRLLACSLSCQGHFPLSAIVMRPAGHRICVTLVTYSQP